jgi:hypothetical protein
MLQANIPVIQQATPSRKGETMNGPKAVDAIFNKLCETFKRLGTDEWIDGYRLGQELGFSKEQMREALAQFEKDEQWKVEIDHSTTEHVRLGSQGKY